MISGTILNDEELYRRAKVRKGDDAAKAAQGVCEKDRKRVMMTVPAEIEAEAKALINKLRADYDAGKMSEARKEAEAKFLRTTSLADWQEQRALDFWSNR